MTPRDNRKLDDDGESAGGEACPSCGAASQPEARFCNACGASLAQRRGGGGLSAAKLIGLATVTGLVAIAVIAVVMLSGRDSTAPSSPAPPMAMPDTPPDLARMSPREAADRLFNRVMAASEQGNRAEALRFAPMAIQAYGNLPALDRDARYHLGHIYAVTGDRANVDRQIAAMRQGAPNHLLALTLEHGMAEQSGDRESVSRILTAFGAAYDTESAIGRPEYAAHRRVIERLRAAAMAQAAPFLAIPPTAKAASVAQADAALLLATNCGGCHGVAATGTGKGPPLVDKIYEPSHHADDAFYRAVRQGVRAHHWSFGDMPPLAGVSDNDVRQIVAYVRELQRAAGIR